MEQDPYSSYLDESDYKPVNKIYKELEYKGVIINFIDTRPKAILYKY